jgi:hypothetical protein
MRREREAHARELDEEEGSGTREALPVGARAEQPTLPDPLAGSSLPPEAFPETTPEQRRPSALVIVLLVLLCLFAGALAALFVGRR